MIFMSIDSYIIELEEICDLKNHYKSGSGNLAQKLENREK